MRIDIESTGFRPDYTPQKPSGEVNELNNRGENVRGRVIDVNQNIVLIQTSTGKQFSASTTVPLENFIDQEMSFAMLVGPSGELILVPEIDDKNKKEIIDLKIEDILAKFGKQPTAENKEIIKLMMKAQMPVTKENFDDIKTLKFAMQMLQQDDFPVELEMDDEQKNINDLIKTMQMKKDFSISKNSNKAILDKSLNLKDILLLKNLDAKVNVENLKALKSILNANGENEVEDFGNILDKDMLIALKTQFMKSNNNQNSVKNIEDFSFKDMEKINSATKNLIFENFDKESSISEKSELTDEKNINIDQLLKNGIDKKEFEIIKNEFMTKFPKSSLKIDKNLNIILDKNLITEDEIIKEFKSIENTINKTLKEGIGHKKEDILNDYSKIRDEIKIIINTLGEDSKASKILEKKLMPKLNILADMANKYNYFVVPFKIDQNRKNVFQYYEKKNKNKNKKQDEINIGLCLDTKNMGNVKTMLYYSKKNGLKIDFSIENEKIKLEFDKNIDELKKIMKIIGFASIDINTIVKKDMKNNLLDDVVYTNDSIKSFEMWI